jgi:hypothetical protein
VNLVLRPLVPSLVLWWFPSFFWGEGRNGSTRFTGSIVGSDVCVSFLEELFDHRG